MTLPRGLEDIERAHVHYAAAERVCRDVLEADPEVSAASLAVYLWDNLATTRKAEDRIAVIGACCAQLPRWRRRLATRILGDDFMKKGAA